LEAIRKKKIDYHSGDISDMEEPQETFSDVFDKIAVKDLLKIIQELPIGFKTVFNLYAIEGYQHKEIGEMLGITESTSRSQLTRARQMLQHKIKGYSGDNTLLKPNIIESGK
jgi:RNA polymerase sigma factor (sigma-70 family)